MLDTQLNKRYTADISWIHLLLRRKEVYKEIITKVILSDVYQRGPMQSITKTKLLLNAQTELTYNIIS